LELPAEIQLLVLGAALEQVVKVVPAPPVHPLMDRGVVHWQRIQVVTALTPETVGMALLVLVFRVLGGVIGPEALAVPVVFRPAVPLLTQEKREALGGRFR
jgi:hypothetical protein